MLTRGEQRLLAAWGWAVGAMGHIGTVLLAMGSILLAFGRDVPALFWSGVGTSLVGLVVQVVRGPRYARLIRDERLAKARSAARSQSLVSILDAALRTFLEDLGVDTTTTRASVYRHRDGSFFLLARVSSSQALERRGRERYPDDQGAIGKAWDKGVSIVIDLPEDRAQWNRANEQDYGMDPMQVASIAMQARSLLGFRLELPAVPPERVGVLVVESLRPRGVNGATADAIAALPSYLLISQVLVEVVRCLDEVDVGVERR